MSTPTLPVDDLFTSAYRNYRPMVRQVILNQLGNGDTYLAEDLAQDTFLRLFQYRERVDLGRSPGGLLMKMAAHSISKHYKARRNRELPVDTGDPSYTERVMESRGSYAVPAATGHRSDRVDLPGRQYPNPAGTAKPDGPTLAEFMAERSEPGPNGCVLWTAGLGGTVHFAGKAHTAQRLAYMLGSGALIPERHAVKNTCHAEDAQCDGGSTCRHRRCVNPQHLRLEHQPGGRRRAKPAAKR